MARHQEYLTTGSTKPKRMLAHCGEAQLALLKGNSEDAQWHLEQLRKHLDNLYDSCQEAEDGSVTLYVK